jgi:hypothetical protein
MEEETIAYIPINRVEVAGTKWITHLFLHSLLGSSHFAPKWGINILVYQVYCDLQAFAV